MTIGPGIALALLDNKPLITQMNNDPVQPQPYLMESLSYNIFYKQVLVFTEMSKNIIL